MASYAGHSHTLQLQDIAASPSLWYRVHVLLFDLQNFDHRPSSRTRLDQVIDPHYIGAPYFTPDETIRLKNMPVHEKSFQQVVSERLAERLDRRMKKRSGSGDFRVCAAHDLAPIMADILRVDLKQLDRDRQFVRLLDTNGLDLQEQQWGGLAKKSFAPKPRKRR